MSCTHDKIRFVIADAATANHDVVNDNGGEVMGVWVDHTSGTPTITLSMIEEGQTTTLYVKASPADGVFNPVRRMQTTAGVNNSGAGEFQHFYIPSGATIRLATSAAWTGNLTLAILR